MKHSRLRILVKGIVQGVGFRPFVHGLANSLNLKGFVMNSSEGVVIEIEGNNNSTSSFIDRLKTESPPLSKIMKIHTVSLKLHGYQDFQIINSKDEGSFTLISVDVSTCNDCLTELMNKNDRRYLYPFINCTNCGPRYTITKSIPYDRPNTTMSVFHMCPDCEKEYNNTKDRRFHAQPNACHVCGPHVELFINNGFPYITPTINNIDDPIKESIRLLKEGKIIAIKGLGGFHIACDALNKESVNRLRYKKRKSNKPFALMAPNISVIKKYCKVSIEEEKILTSPQRPILLLNKLENRLPDAISPNNPYLGFMLPYTPLHYLLFYYPIKDNLNTHFEALIMTSGNISEEPIVIDNEEAFLKLSEIADAFLIHNRDIFMRIDDSVLRVMNTESKYSNLTTNKCRLSFIRRSRGYVPAPIPLHDDGPEVLGCGSDIKNTFTLTKSEFAIPSQHIGDMENYETLKFFEECLNNLKNVYRVNPIALAYDLHPDYISTQWALKQKGIKKIGIQHHHAHIASVMAEKGLKDNVIGIAFDGTGYGTDGNLWGGEFLIANISGYKRAGHFKYIPLPGGETSIKEPWRTTISYIKDLAGPDTKHYLDIIGFTKKYGEDTIQYILKIIDNKTFSPLSSGAGRLFDAVSALLGICDTNTFEGEAAIALEALTLSDVEEDYPIDIKFREIMEIDFSQTILSIINDLQKGVKKEIISSKFHNTIVTVIERVVQKLYSINLIKDVVLCGGVFQNMYLLEKTLSRLTSSGMNVHIHEKVPTNDAGISLGQAYIIRELMKKGVNTDNRNTY